MKLQHRACWLRLKYNLSPEEYEALLIKQNFCCAICKIPQSECIRRFAIDHNHITKKNRGLLCFRCNASIGKFGDDIDLIETAINYLKEYQDARPIFGHKGPLHQRR